MGFSDIKKKLHCVYLLGLAPPPTIRKIRHCPLGNIGIFGLIGDDASENLEL